MKKFLSLVLALVMTMSLVTISAGAKDFTDDAAIDYKEAVAVMSELKIVDGTADGAFNPDGALTRGAAAKIICNLILGPTTAAALKADTAPFPDVAANHTFAGYIAYCAQQGIISGYADGTFRPSNPLTGYAFMKMLLGALGYDKAVEGFDGANWSVNVAKLAISLGLDDGNDDFNGVATVTREEALLYAFNTMKATMVEYDTTTSINVNGASVVIAGSKAKRVEDNAAAKNDYREDTDAQDGYVQFCEKYFPKLELSKTGKTDVFGRPAQTWYNGNNKIGTFAKEADLVYYTNQTAKTIYTDLDLDKAYTYDVVVDGVDGVDLLVTKKDNANTNNVNEPKVKLTGAGNGSLIEVFEDEQKIVVINTYLMQVQGDYNEKKEELKVTTIGDNTYPQGFASTKTLESEDWVGLDAFKDEDYVTVTIAAGDIETLALCEPVVATVTDYVHEESLTAGGETYKYSFANNNTAAAYSLKKDAKLYLDDQGNILYAKAVAAEEKFVYISEFAPSSLLNQNAKLIADAIFTDGTEDEIVISKVTYKANNVTTTVKVKGGNDTNTGLNLDGAAGNEVTDGAWYEFVEKDGKYELTANSNVGGAVTANAGIQVTDYDGQHAIVKYEENGTAKTIYGTKNTIFVVEKADGKIVTYTGIKNVPEIKAAKDSVVVVNNNDVPTSYTEVVFIKLATGSTIKGGNTSSDVVFLIDYEKHGNDVDDDEYYRYKALVNGEEKKVYVEKIGVTGQLAEGLYTDIEYSSKNVIVAATQVANNAFTNRDEFTVDTIAANTDDVIQSGNTLTINGKDYFMADEYTIFVIDASEDDYDTYTMKQLAAKDLVKNDKIWGVLNDDAEYTALYIYTA